MAIKGKSKKRSGARTRAALPPRPVVVERKPPMLARKPVQRGIIIVLALAAVLGGLRVWQNLARSSALRAYDKKLTRAQAPLLQALDPSSFTSLSNNSSQFSTGQIASKDFLATAQKWETDFTTVKTDVSKLKGPKQLGDAQALILQGIDDYIGVARLYQVAALQQQLADATSAKAKAEKDKTAAKDLNDRAAAEKGQVQVLVLHAGEWLQRATATYQLGVQKLTNLEKAWHLPQPAPVSSSGTTGGAPIPISS